MSINEMEAKIKKLQEWEQLAADAKAEAEALRDEIKAEMLNQKNRGNDRREIYSPLDIGTLKPL